MNLGTLTIEMAANIGKLKTDMDAAKGLVDRTMTNIVGSVDMAKKAFIGLTGIASIKAFESMVLGVVEAGAALHDLSISAGISVEKLSGLASIGKFSGQTAESLAGSMNKLSKSLASSNEDSKGAAAALKALGLSFDEFQTMSPDERMLKISQAMGGFQDGAQKSAAAMMLFGKTGAELLPFMKDLATAGEIHAKVTTAQAAAADDFDDKLVQLKANGDAWKKSLVYELLPAMNDVIDAVLEIRKSTSTQGSVIGEALSEGLRAVAVLGLNVAYVLKGVGTEIGGLFAQVNALMHGDFKGAGVIGDQMKADAAAARIEVERLSAAMLGLGPKATPEEKGPDKRPALKGLNGSPTGAAKPEWEADLAKFNKATIEQIRLAGESLAANRDLTESEKYRIKMLADIDTSKLTAPQKALMKTYVDVGVTLMDEAKARDFTLKALALDTAEREKAWDAAQKYSDALDAASNEMAFQTSLIGKDADAVRMLTEMRKLDIAAQAAQAAAKGDPAAQAQIMAQAAEAQKRMTAGMVAAKDAQDKLNTSWEYGAKNALDNYLKQVNNVAASTERAMTNAFQGMEDALVSFAQTGTLNFNNLANSIIADLIRIQIQQSITGPIAAAMKSGGGLFAMLGFADGGSPPVGVPSIVGERGPEVFVPNTAGTIIPNGALGGGSVTVNQPIVINANNASAETVGQIRAMMPSMIAENKRVVEAVIKQAMARRGGRLTA